MSNLNPSEKTFGKQWAAQAKMSKSLDEQSIEELRAGVRGFSQFVGPAADVEYEDRKIPVRNGGVLRCRVFNCDISQNAPILIFYPGCAFVFDLFDVNAVIASRVALYSDVKVILVQFRLAPEHPMAASIYDGYDAALYIANHPGDFGIDPSRLFLGGWCSGAHCAAAVSSLARNQMKIAHQILLSGSYDYTHSTRGYDQYEREDKILNRSFTEYIAKRFYGGVDLRDPLLSPFYQKDLQRVPPTTILCAEYDALRSDSEGYFAKLQLAGVPVQKIILPGQTHNTIAMRTVLTDGLDPSEAFAKVISQFK